MLYNLREGIFIQRALKSREFIIASNNFNLEKLRLKILILLEPLQQKMFFFYYQICEFVSQLQCSPCMHGGTKSTQSPSRHDGGGKKRWTRSSWKQTTETRLVRSKKDLLIFKVL